MKFQAPQWYQDRVGKKFGSSFSVHRAHKPNAKPMPFYVFQVSSLRAEQNWTGSCDANAMEVCYSRLSLLTQGMRGRYLL